MILSLAYRLSREKKTLLRIVERQHGRIALLERERDQARADAELVLGMVPDDLKRAACALVRTRHDVVNLPQVEPRRIYDQEAG